MIFCFDSTKSRGIALCPSLSLTHISSMASLWMTDSVGEGREGQEGLWLDDLIVA